jgi:hypothetical protein
VVALVGNAVRGAANTARQLIRPFDYPVTPDDWLSLCRDPQALHGSHDWGLAVASVGSPACRHTAGGPGTSLETLLCRFVETRDPKAGEALAVLAARFADRFELGSQFDCACTLPSDFRSGPGDPSHQLFAWPGVPFPLAVRATLFAWALAAGEATPPGPAALWSTEPVHGRSVLIVAARFDAERTDAAVHCLRASGVRRVGVFALVGPGDSLAV